MEIIINANREGYGTDQVRQTMTVGELIEWLEETTGGNMDLPVYIGNDPKSYGWYTYGGIRENDIVLTGEEEEEE